MEVQASRNMVDQLFFNVFVRQAVNLPLQCFLSGIFEQLGIDFGGEIEIVFSQNGVIVLPAKTGVFANYLLKIGKLPPHLFANLLIFSLDIQSKRTIVANGFFVLVKSQLVDRFVALPLCPHQVTAIDFGRRSEGPPRSGFYDAFQEQAVVAFADICPVLDLLLWEDEELVGEVDGQQELAELMQIDSFFELWLVFGGLVKSFDFVFVGGIDLYDGVSPLVDFSG